MKEDETYLERLHLLASSCSVPIVEFKDIEMFGVGAAVGRVITEKGVRQLDAGMLQYVFQLPERRGGGERVALSVLYHLRLVFGGEIPLWDVRHALALDSVQWYLGEDAFYVPALFWRLNAEMAAVSQSPLWTLAEPLIDRNPSLWKDIRRAVVTLPLSMGNARTMELVFRPEDLYLQRLWEIAKSIPAGRAGRLILDKEHRLGRRPQRELLLGALAAPLSYYLHRFTVGQFSLYLGVSLHEGVSILDRLSRIVPLTALDGEDRFGFLGRIWLYCGKKAI